jgi:hypothetical protein
MTKEEAIQALLDGKLVAPEGVDNMYIFKSGNSDLNVVYTSQIYSKAAHRPHRVTTIDSYDIDCIESLFVTEFMHSDWELYTGNIPEFDRGSIETVNIKITDVEQLCDYYTLFERTKAAFMLEHQLRFGCNVIFRTGSLIGVRSFVGLVLGSVSDTIKVIELELQNPDDNTTSIYVRVEDVLVPTLGTPLVDKLSKEDIVSLVKSNLSTSKDANKAYSMLWIAFKQSL